MSRLPNLLRLSIHSNMSRYLSSSCIFSRLTTRPCSRIDGVRSVHDAPQGKLSSIKNFLKQPTSSAIDQIEWHTVYRFPLIVHARVFSRSKLYLTLITGLGAPYAALGCFTGAITVHQMLGFFAICGFSTSLLYAFGHAFRRLIGSIYLSSDQQLVRISHLTFFGNRQETVLPLGDIAPLSDSNPNLRDIFLRVSSADPSLDTLKDSLFLSLRFGGIVDLEKFTQIFGSS